MITLRTSLIALFATTVAFAERPDNLESFVETHCLDCHEGPDADGNLDLFDLDFDLSNEETARRWILVHDRVAAGEMPPEKKKRPDEAKSAGVLQLLAAEIEKAEAKRSDVVLRRLNRREYQNTVNDLFLTDVIITGLPEDNPTNGFDNVGEGLAVSAEAMAAYLETADKVLDAVFGPPKEPKRIRHETNLLKQVDWKGNPSDAQWGKMFRVTNDGLVIFQSGYCPTNLVNFAREKPPAGTYRGTIKARAIQSDKPVTLRIYGGDTIVNRREQHLVGYYDVSPGEWTTIEFTDRLVEDGGTYLPKCYNTRDTRKDADTYPEPGIELGDIIIEGPLEEWPPKSRAHLLGEGEPDAAEIINRILPKAFRRETTTDEAQPYLTLFENAIAEGREFESALRVSLKAILCSPEFLFLDEPGDDYLEHGAFASRLSYFLWSTMPDQQLLDADLDDSKVLRQQVERMLNDPKSEEFVKNFTGQWLDLRDINFTEPDANLFPEFDELLRISMVRETEMYFRDVLGGDSSVVDFVDSDYTFLNERLAAHYGIEGVTGQEFRKVQLPSDSIRGGLLTQGSILKITANGTNTSPVLRGDWVLKNILGQPTSPPPDNVGSVEPDIRGASTIREQLEKHRDVKSCAACHDKIDPPGFALECFDPIGGLRTHYRTMAEDAQRPNLKQAPFTYAWVRYRIGQPVDATGEMHTGEPFADVREFKELLARDPDQLTQNLAEKLLTYGTGRKIGFADRPAIERIVLDSSTNHYGLRSLIHAIIQDPIFRRR